MIQTFIILFFFLFLISFFGKEQSKSLLFVKLFIGLILFPPCVAVLNKPLIAPEHCFFLVILGSIFFTDYGNFIDSLKKFPSKGYISVLIGTFILAGIHTEGGLGFGIYVALRAFIDSVAIVFLTFHFGRFADLEYIKKQLSRFVLVCFICCVVEYLLKYNILYKEICLSFPYYNGIFSLSGLVSSSEGWRPRVFFTTVHANTWGAILDCFFWIYAPDVFKKDSQGRSQAIISCLLIFLMILFTGSSTALACVLGTCAFFFFRKLNVYQKLIVIVLVLLLGSTIVYKVEQQFSAARDGSNIDLRTAQLAFTLMEIQKNPWFGEGFHYIGDHIFARDNYGDLLDSSLSYEIGGLESVLFSWWIERGLAFLLAFFIYMLAIFWYFEKRKDTPGALCGQYIALSISMFLILSGEMGGNTCIAFCLIGLFMGLVYDENLHHNSDL